MPVRPRFVPSTSAEVDTFRAMLKLDNASTILINGGARGGGPILKIYETIRKASAESNILVVCGKNRRLQRRIERRQDAKTRTFGFLDDIHKYIAASDLVVTKPGALSTYEALACNVPVLLFGMCGLMPQESGLFQACAHYDFGFAAATFDDMAKFIKSGPIGWERKRESVSYFYRPSSGAELIERMQPAHVQA